MGILAVVAGALLLGSAFLGAPSGDCAPPADGSIIESADFTSAQENRGPREIAITAFGSKVEGGAAFGVSDSLDGLPIQWVIAPGNGSTYAYYLRSPLANGMTTSDFLASGGLELDVEPRDDSADFAAYLLATLGERAVPVRVADHDGALTYADPSRSGVRSHNLYWADDSHDFALIGVRAPEDLVTIGRTVACG